MEYSGEEVEAGVDPLEAVRARYEAQLLAIDGVIGVGLGGTPPDESGLTVYVRDDASRQRVPLELDGCPVFVEVSGEIRLQDE